MRVYQFRHPGRVRGRGRYGSPGSRVNPYLLLVTLSPR